MGTVKEGLGEFFSARLSKKERKKTLVDELLVADEKFRCAKLEGVGIWGEGMGRGIGSDVVDDCMDVYVDVSGACRQAGRANESAFLPLVILVSVNVIARRRAVIGLCSSVLFALLTFCVRRVFVNFILLYLSMDGVVAWQHGAMKVPCLEL